MTATTDITALPSVRPATNGGIDPRVAALARILKDPSGVDLAEFAMKDYSQSTTRWYRCPVNPKHYIVAGTRPDPKNEPTVWLEPGPCQQCAIDGNHQPLVAMNKGGVATRCYRVRPYQLAWFRCNDPKQIDSCIAAGQLIVTADGMKPVEDIEVGDLVLTGLGRWKPVEDLVDMGERDVVTMTGQGHPGITLTPDHQVLAARSRRASQPRDGHKSKILGDLEWMRPQDWEWNDGSGTMVANWTGRADVAPLPVDPIEEPYRSAQQNTIPDPLDPDWLWLYGLWLAEGSVYVDDPTKGLVHRAQWTSHVTKAEAVAKRLDRLGIRFIQRVTDHSDRCIVTSINSRPLTRWLVRNGGRGAHHKRIASWVFGLPEHLRQQVFDGACYDVHERSSGRRDYTTVSRELAAGMRILGNSLGYSASWYIGKGGSSVIDGRRIQGGSRYKVDFQLLDGQAKPRVHIRRGLVYGPVTKIAPADRARVYDLQVADDRSFVVEGVIVSNCGRSVGKSERAKLRVASFPFRHRGQEMVLVAPLGKHVDALTQRIEPAFANTRILREMLKGGSTSTGINHRPFKITFANGSVFYTRLPGHDGQGVKGIHPVILEVDEGQDINERTWDELPETVRWDLDGAMMIVHGVTTGERNRFHRMTYSENSGYTWHRYTRVHGSDWTPQVRAEQIEAYNGSAEDPGYLRNVLGEPGGMANRIFILSSLERGKDDDRTSYYNEVDYHYVVVTPERIRDAMPRAQRASDPDDFEAQADALINLIDLPQHHLERYRDADIWIGADIGYVEDPTEIIVVANYRPDATELKTARAQKLWVPDGGESLFKVIARFHLKYVDEPLQEELVIALIEHYQPRAFAMDKTGNGLGLWQRLMARAGRSTALFEMTPDPETTSEQELLDFWARRSRARATTSVIQGFNFSQKILVDLDDDKLAELKLTDPDPDMASQIEYAGVWANVKDQATDVLRARIVEQKRLRLPADDEIVIQMNGQKMRFERNTFNAHGKRRAYSEGVFHILDAMRMWALAWSQQRMERFAAEARAEKAKPAESVIDYFG